ncbi:MULTISPECIES: hypothetical protein [unclassified Yoonia]|uniref:hypothetical protein n=1 Tax=unclassified Yoonia TaxID=2629118 RepID=UPI002AFF362D|nr:MULTISPECIES: hypothetical protein [unclassified Yoonia]
MTRLVIAMMALAVLSACDAVSVLDESAAPPAPVNIVPEAIAGDLKAASYAAATDTMVIRITLDANTLDAVYARDDRFLVPGYLAFTTQDDPLDRFVTAFYRSSADGSVQASLVMDGGQFTKYFGGTTFGQTGTYTAPAQGLASYAGTYVGMLNIGTRDGTLPSDQTGERLPGRAVRVTGDVFLNADFTNGAVNGIVDGRTFGDTVTGLFDAGDPMPSIFLVPAPIAANGSFAGGVENRAEDSLGTYAGTFGGSNAAGVAGGIRLTGDFLPGLDKEEEYGIFVLDQCGSTPVVCDSVNTLND